MILTFSFIVVIAILYVGLVVAIIFTADAVVDLIEEILNKGGKEFENHRIKD